MKKKNWSALALIAFACLLAFPQAGPGQGQTAVGASNSAERLRRDLGEKGQIVIDSLDLYDQDIESVVRLLARVAGINIITGNISGAISVYLENVTVQDALEAILASQGYGFIYDGNIVRVVEASRLGEDRVETITETFMLNYLAADKVAETLRAVLQGGAVGSNYSQIEANAEANAIVAVDIPRRMEDIRRMIGILDHRFEQVEIEGRFVEISYDQQQDWGVDWRYFQDPANALDVNLAPQPINADNVAGQFKFAIIRGSDNLQGFLQMLETTNDIKILASPKTLTVENEEASIELTDEIPFIETNVSQGVITESVQFQQTGIRLIVTPTVAQEADGTYVTLRLELEQRIPGPRVVLGNSIAFPVDSRRAQSVLVAPDESTVVIGGLKSNDQSYTYNKIPFLGSVPVIGSAFRRRTKSEEQTELLLFVTPRVIYDTPPLDFREMERHESIDRTMDELDTQHKWRDRAELPIDVIDKGILYSNVEVNSEVYDHYQQTQDCIEKIQPYKVSKPKGERPKIHITGRNGELKEEYEYVDEEPSGAVESATQAQTRDFSVVEEKALPANNAPSGARAGQEGGEGQPGESQPSAPQYAPPAIQIIPPPPPQAPSEGSGEGEGKGPSWLRRGNQRGAADPIEQGAEEAAAEPAQEPVQKAAAGPVEGEVLLEEDPYYADLDSEEQAGLQDWKPTEVLSAAVDPWADLQNQFTNEETGSWEDQVAPPEPPSSDLSALEVVESQPHTDLAPAPSQVSSGATHEGESVEVSENADLDNQPPPSQAVEADRSAVESAAPQPQPEPAPTLVSTRLQPAPQPKSSQAIVPAVPPAPVIASIPPDAPLEVQDFRPSGNPEDNLATPWETLLVEGPASPPLAPPAAKGKEGILGAPLPTTVNATPPTASVAVDTPADRPIPKADLTAVSSTAPAVAQTVSVPLAPAANAELVTPALSPKRVDLRASAPASPASRPNLRKYLDSETLAAMEQLDQVDTQQPQAGPVAVTAEGPANPSPWEPVDPAESLWDTPLGVSYAIPTEANLLGSAPLIAHNDTPVPPRGEPAKTQPIAQPEKKSGWWNRLFADR